MTQCLTVQPTIVKLVTSPSLPACTLNQKKTIAINTGPLAYKLGDNPTNNDGDIDVKYTALSASMPSGLNRADRSYLELFDDDVAGGSSDGQLDGRQRRGRDPDGPDNDRRLGRGDARAERIEDDPEPVDADRDRRADGRRDADHLEEEDDGAHRRREDPVAEHREGEGERHADDGHDEVGGGEVDEVPAQVGVRVAATDDERGDRQHVADDRDQHR